eukprot:6118766-Amphidinium_carterae.1
MPTGREADSQKQRQFKLYTKNPQTKVHWIHAHTTLNMPSTPTRHVGVVRAQKNRMVAPFLLLVLIGISVVECELHWQTKVYANAQYRDRGQADQAKLTKWTN